jgi:hypothetical protein
MSSNLYVGLDTPPCYHQCLKLLGRYLFRPSASKDVPVNVIPVCASETVKVTQTPIEKGKKKTAY